MPWDVKKQGKKWAIIKKTTGKVVGHSTSKKKAEASVRARYWGAAQSGEKLSDVVRAAVLLDELNELADSGWDLQTVIFNKEKYKTREEALAKAKEMGFYHSTSRETGDENSGSWRIRQRPDSDFSEFRSQKISPDITLVHGKLKK